MNILFVATIAVVFVITVWRMAGRAITFGGWVAWSSLLIAIVPSLGALTPSAWT